VSAARQLLAHGKGRSSQYTVLEGEKRLLFRERTELAP